MVKRDFKEILECLKKYIKIKNSVKGNITLEMIYNELKMKSSVLRVRKLRNTIPYDVILDYCFSEEINPLNVFYDRKVKP